MYYLKKIILKYNLFIHQLWVVNMFRYAERKSAHTYLYFIIKTKNLQKHLTKIGYSAF